MAGPSSGSEGTSVAIVSAGYVETGVGGPNTREKTVKKPGSALEYIPGSGGDETTAETAAVDSSPRISQDILGDFHEEWLENLDKDELKSIKIILIFMLSLCACIFLY